MSKQYTIEIEDETGSLTGPEIYGDIEEGKLYDDLGEANEDRDAILEGLAACPNREEYADIVGFVMQGSCVINSKAIDEL